MARPMVNDLDYLAARLHARRGRMAEAERLDALCGLRSVPDLARAVDPTCEAAGAVEFERHLVQQLARELAAFQSHMDGARARLFDRLRDRFLVENLKVLIRGLARRAPFESWREHLVGLPGDPGLDFAALASAQTLGELASRLPPGAARTSLRAAGRIHGDSPPLFFTEAALDRGYFLELLAALEALPSSDHETVRAIVLQEVDIFHLMLVARGRFGYGLTPEQLAPLHVPGSAITRTRFAEWLADADLSAVAGHALGIVIDTLPAARGASSQETVAVDPTTLEALAWERFWRLANRAFRRGQMGLGVVIGYVGLRRIEVANLITLCEGIRLGMPGERIRARLIPRHDWEAIHAAA